MFYYSVAISLLIYFLIKPFSSVLYAHRIPFLKTHLTLLALSITDLLLMAAGWRFAGAYTTLILFALTICTGIICARFFIDGATSGKVSWYFKIVRVFTIVFLVLGMMPIITGYGGGFLKNALDIEYISYSTGQGYVYRIVKQGNVSCNSLRLYQQVLFIEHDIPVASIWDEKYDCFDPLRFTIVKADKDTLVAEAKFRGSELEYFILDKKNKKLNYNRYCDGYTLVSHQIDLGYLSYQHKYSKSHMPVDTFMELLSLQQEYYGYMHRFVQDEIRENPEDSAIFKPLDSIVAKYE